MIIRRATQVQIRAALDVANEQFGGNLRFQELEDLQAPRTPKFKVRLDVEDLEGPGSRRGYLSYYYGHSHKLRRSQAACYHASGAFMVALLERVPEAAVIEAGARGFEGGRYHGVEGFLEHYRAAGETNVGSQRAPIAFEDSCNCWEHLTDFIDTDTLTYIDRTGATPPGGAR
jgi:hypothetical protein